MAFDFGTRLPRNCLSHVVLWSRISRISRRRPIGRFRGSRREWATPWWIKLKPDPDLDGNWVKKCNFLKKKKKQKKTCWLRKKPWWYLRRLGSCLGSSDPPPFNTDSTEGFSTPLPTLWWQRTFFSGIFYGCLPSSNTKHWCFFLKSEKSLVKKKVSGDIKKSQKWNHEQKKAKKRSPMIQTTHQTTKNDKIMSTVWYFYAKLSKQIIRFSKKHGEII